MNPFEKENWIVWHKTAISGSQLKGLYIEESIINISEGILDIENIIILVYEHLENGSNVEKEAFKLGCCPKGGNFIGINGFPCSPIKVATRLISEMLESYPGIAQIEGVKENLESIQDIYETAPNVYQRMSCFGKY